jgi:hypothetical protein
MRTAGTSTNSLCVHRRATDWHLARCCTTLLHATRCCLAQFSLCCPLRWSWQGLSWVNNIDGPVFALFPGEVKKAWAAWVRSVSDPGFECDGDFYKRMTVPESVAGIRADLLANYAPTPSKPPGY